MFTVYYLTAPGDKEPRYVGQTKQTLKQRKSWFKVKKRAHAFHEWMETINYNPDIFALTTCDTREEALTEETVYIDLFRSLGFRLCNVRRNDHDRTPGWPGGHHTEETKRIQSLASTAANLGRSRPDIAERNQQKVWDAATRKKSSIATRAAMQRPEVRAKQEAYWNRRWPHRVGK
jgi:hypothetical protein